MDKPVSDQNHRTPAWLFDDLQDLTGVKFKLDAAATAKNALCKKFYTEKDDGLSQPWKVHTFCNPPYKEFRLWVNKGRREAEENDIIVCMIGPKGCSQKWFHEDAKLGTIYAPNQRISFNDSKTGKPTRGAREDSMIYIFGNGFWNSNHKTRFMYLPMDVYGKVVTL